MQRPAHTEQSTAQQTFQTTADQIAIVNDLNNQATLQAVMNNPENTMTEEACKSVNSVLIRLAKRYLEFHVDAQGQMHLNENKLNQYLADLKQKIETQISKYETELKLEKEEAEKKEENEAPTHSSQTSSNDSENQPKEKKIDYGFLKSAWEFMQDKMQEAPNQLDQVTFFEGDKKITVIIDIQTTLALVYAAITDTEIFKPDAPDFEKNQQERFYSLFMSFKRLQHDTKQRCHQGVRHDLVICNLSGTYSDAIIVSEPKGFLADLISEAIFKLVEKIKIEFGQEMYLDVIKECLMGEVHPELAKQLGDKSELRKAIHGAFRYVGLDPANPKYEIEKYIRALNVVVTLPEGLKALGTQVHTLLQSNTKQANELNSRAQFIEFMKTQWLKTQFSLANSEHQDTISILSQVEAAYAACWQYGSLFKSSKVNPLLSIEEFHSIYKQIDDYYQSALSKQAPIKATEIFLNQLEKLKIALKPLEKDMEWVSNIFARWKAAWDHCQSERSDDSLNHLIQLHQEIINPDIQSHYLVNDEFLKGIFKPQDGNVEDQFELFQNEFGLVFRHTQNQKIDLDYFNINRLFLSAITIAPKDWTPLFFERLKDTLQFLTKELSAANDSSINSNTKALMRDSYTENLWLQLWQSMNQYKKIHELEFNEIDREVEKDSESKGFYIPVLNQVKDLKSAIEYFRLLPESKHDEFSQYLKDHDICQSDDEDKIRTEVKKFEKSFIQFSSAEKENEVMKMFLSIHSNYLIGIFHDDLSKLIQLLTHIKQDQKFKILNHLGIEYIKELVAKVKFYVYAESLFEAFPEASRIDLLNWLGIDFMRDWASNESISFFIQVFPENKKLDILKKFGLGFFKENYSYRSFEQVLILFEDIDQASRIDLLNWIGMDFLKNVNLDYEILKFIKCFPESNRLDILKQFGLDFFKKNESYRSFEQVLNLFKCVDQASRIDLLNWIGMDFLKNVDLDYEILKFIKCFPESNRLDVLKQFDAGSLRKIYLESSPDDLIQLFSSFNKEESLSLLNHLGDDFIKEFVLSWGNGFKVLLSLLDSLPIEQRLGVISKWNNAFLKTQLLIGNEVNILFTLLFFAIEKEEQAVLFNDLGVELIKESMEKSKDSQDCILTLMRLFFEKENINLIKQIGADYIKTKFLNIKSFDQLKIFLFLFKDDKEKEFLNWIGMDFLKKCVLENSNFSFAKRIDGLYYLPEEIRREILYSISPLVLAHLDCDSLKQILSKLPKSQSFDWLKNHMGISNLHIALSREIFDFDTIMKLSDYIEPIDRIEFLNWIGSEFLRSLVIQNASQTFIWKVSKKFKTKELSLKNTDALPPRKNTGALFQPISSSAFSSYEMSNGEEHVLSSPSYSAQFQFLQFWGGDILAREIYAHRKSDLFMEIITTIPGEERFSFVTLLGVENVKNIIFLNNSNSHYFGVILNEFPLSSRYKFLNWLGSKSLRSIAEGAPKGVLDWMKKSIYEHFSQTFIKSFFDILGKKFILGKINNEIDLNWVYSFDLISKDEFSELEEKFKKAESDKNNNTNVTLASSSLTLFANPSSSTSTDLLNCENNSLSKYFG